MKHLRWLAGLLACALFGLASPALADNQTSKNASGSTFTFCTKTASSVEYPCHLMYFWDGSTLRQASSDSSGRLNVNINGSVGLTSNYAEDAAHVTADPGTFALSVRKDTAASTAGTDGDYAGFVTDANGRLYTTPQGAVTAADGSALTNTLKGFSLGGTYNGSTVDMVRSIINATNSTGTGIPAVGLVAQLDDTSPTAITENQFGNLRMNDARALKTQNGDITNPTATWTRPADTNPEAVNDGQFNSTTAGSVVLPTFTISGHGVRIASGRLYSNHTTGLDSVVFNLDLWFTAATFTNGDNGAYAVATSGNGANWAGSMTCGGFRQFADGAVAECWSTSGFTKALKSGTTLAVSAYTSTAYTPQSGKTFTFAPNLEND